MTTETANIQSTEKSSRHRDETSIQIWLRRFTALAPLWTLLALGIFFSLASPSFARPINLNNILAQISVLAIFGTGMTFVLLTAEIDLSIAGVAALSGMVAAHLFVNLEMQEPYPFIAGLATATVMGFVNGFVSAKFRIPTFMTTLAMSLIAAGLTTYISKARTLTKIPEISATLGSDRIGGPQGIQVIIIVAAITLLIGHIILRYTRFGRYVYMTGANKEAARLVGVNTDRVIIVVMTICGFTAGLAGMVSMGRLGSAQPQEVPSYLIDAIGAVVLGGTSLMGGRGSIPRTVIGLLLYGTLRNGLDNMHEIDVFLKDFIKGVVLLAALMINVFLSGKESRDKTN